MASGSGTIHVFRLTLTGGLPVGDQGVKVVNGDSYLPAMVGTVVNDLWEGERDFARVRLHVQGVPYVSAISSNNQRVMVITANGFFYQYSLDTIQGGDCKLEKERTVSASESDHISAHWASS